MDTTTTVVPKEATDAKKLKTTSMKLSADTQEKLRELVASMSFKTQDELLQFLISQLTFAGCSEHVPNRSQAVAEVQSLFKRLLDKYTENFDMANDIAQVYEDKITEIQKNFQEKIHQLEEKNQQLERDNLTLKEALDRVGGERSKQ